MASTIMTNGLPGKVSTVVAEHIADSEDLILHPYSLTGQEVEKSRISLKGLEKKLKEDAIFIIPKLSEAKTIINPELLKGYKDCRFTKGNTKYYLEQTKIIINLNKTWIKMGYGLGVSSLISVIRGLYMIKWENYSKSSFLGFLEDHGLDTGKLYELYYKEQRRIKVKDSSTVSKEDLRKLVKLAEEMLSVRKN